MLDVKRLEHPRCDELVHLIVLNIGSHLSAIEKKNVVQVNSEWNFAVSTAPSCLSCVPSSAKSNFQLYGFITHEEQSNVLEAMKLQNKNTNGIGPHVE